MEILKEERIADLPTGDTRVMIRYEYLDYDENNCEYLHRTKGFFIKNSKGEIIAFEYFDSGEKSQKLSVIVYEKAFAELTSEFDGQYGVYDINKGIVFTNNTRIVEIGEDSYTTCEYMGAKVYRQYDKNGKFIRKTISVGDGYNFKEFDQGKEK